MNKIVTIIISAYNKAEYLERCVSSLIGRNIDKAEIIIVNDGSTDGTSAIAHKLSSSCPSVVVVDKENGHQGSCVNVALSIATGKYVRMLDADDYFDTSVFDQYLDLLESYDADMVITGHIINRGEGVVIAPTHMECNKVLPLAEVNFRKLGLEGCLGMHGVTYRTDIFRKYNIKLTEHCSFADAEFCYYPIEHCKTVMFMKEVLYCYQTGIEGQESSLKSNKIKEDAFVVCNRMLGNYESVLSKSHLGGVNNEIVLCRCLTAYLAIYLLHFKSNPLDQERSHYLLYKAKKVLPSGSYNNLIQTTMRKIPFIKIFQLTGMTSFYLFSLLESLYKYVKSV